MAFPISEEVNPGLFRNARLAVFLVSSSLNCRGPMAFLAAYSKLFILSIGSVIEKMRVKINKDRRLRKRLQSQRGS